MTLHDDVNFHKTVGNTRRADASGPVSVADKPHPRHPLTIVAAIAQNGVIGVRNTLPWRLRSDLARFRALTTGKPVIMGRKTFESLPPAPSGSGGAAGKGRAGRLPGRPLVVIGRPGFAILPEDGEVVRVDSFAAAVAAADAIADRDGADEIIVAGGGEIFSLALPYARYLRITRVLAQPEGDAFFPDFDETQFHETAREHHEARSRDDHAFVFIDYERQKPVPAA